MQTKTNETKACLRRLFMPSSHETDWANYTAPHELNVYCDYCNAAAGTTLSKQYLAVFIL